MEVLVATMYKKNEEEIIALVEKMNISTNAVVVNQNDEWEDEKTVYHNGKRIKYISIIDRGLSKSRNLAIKYATDDIIIIADDDVIYENNYFEIISQTYNDFPKAQGIGFAVHSTNNRGQKTVLKEGKLNIFQTMKLSSFQLTFRLKEIKGTYFDEQFGAGSRYSMGEENIFLVDLYRKKKNIYNSQQKIGNVNHEESTWFSGFNEKFLFDTGAIYKRMFGVFAPIMNLQFVIRKKSLFEKDWLYNYNVMNQGAKKFKERSNNI